MSFNELTLANLAAPQKNAIVGGPFGSNLVSKDYVDYGIPVIRGANMGEKWVGGDFVYVSREKSIQLSQNIAKPGDLVFTQRGTLGQVSIVPKHKHDCYVVSQSQMKLTVDPLKADVDFLYYLFKSPEQLEYIRNAAIQTGVPHTNLGILKKTPIKIPALLVQQQAAFILSALDDRITLLRETNTTLEAIAQALFKSWFVDFDPVRAKQEGRVPEGMDAATAALFPDSFEESELGLLPRGWSFGTLADLAELNPESWTTKVHPKTVLYIDLANTKNNEIDVTTEYVFDEAPSRARRVLRTGDSIIGTVRPGNRSFAYIYRAARNLTGSTGFAVLRPKVIKNAEFIFIAATQNSSIDYLAHIADGGAYPAVRPEVVANIELTVPHEEVIAAFHDIVAPLSSMIGENQLTIQTLVTLRDTLLPRLISGQLRLPEAEAMLEDLAA
ncbi:Type I restriction-modification system, specificity subunit S [Oxalobacteraceae bacterium IMCC9480]|jgi:type I restriction enzyme S subunit|nr:Type I restriction-modification system, specificity subunit S [Oxalobacteraceae bacterium IMCC9480]